MLNDNAKKLVAALRSGEYTQTKGRLHRVEVSDEFDGFKEKPAVGYCCLGVACELYAAENPTEREVFASGYEGFDGRTATLPETVMGWLGLASRVGSMDNGESLATLNDYRDKTFAEIADVIESEPEGLFV